MKLEKLDGRLADWRERIEAGIDRWVPASEEPPVLLHAAMRHSLEAGGKRIRPVLACACAEALGAPADPLPAAVAIECLHTYTLIHDDLPAMDDSDLRRGHPTCHRAFGEAAAVLAGDALLTLAFEIIARGYAEKPSLALSLIAELAEASGSRQLVGGQMEDIENEGRDIGVETLASINAKKTGALIAASCSMGALVGGAGPALVATFRAYGLALGGAFQVVDDILDHTASDSALGKTSGRDAANGKTTFAGLEGVDAARRRATRLTAEAEEALARIPGDTAFLRALTRRLLDRGC